MKNKSQILKIILLIPIIVFYSKNYATEIDSTKVNSSEKPAVIFFQNGIKYFGLDSSQIQNCLIKITKGENAIEENKMFIEKQSNIIKHDSLTQKQYINCQELNANLEKAFTNANLNLLDCLNKPATVITAKWWYYALSIVIGAIMGFTAGILTK